MPALNLSRQAARDFENVRLQVEALVSNFNTSVMEVLGKYHQCTLEHCNAELGAVRSQLAEQRKEFQKQLEYRDGMILRLEQERNDVIMRLEKEKNDMKNELNNQIQEARKLANFERLDLRPSPSYCHLSGQVESEPETSHSHQSRDLESVISRLKNKHGKPSRQLPRRRHTHDVTVDLESILAQAERVPDLIPVANVEITERVVEVKEEYDVDDNDVPVLSEKEVEKLDTPVPTGDGIDIVDVATNSPSTSQTTLDSPGPSHMETDRTSETSQEPNHSDTSSDGERPNNNNDLTFVNRQADQLSLPLKKRKPPPKKRQAKTPEPEKPKPRRVKALSSDSSLDSRAALESRIRSEPSVAISEDEITPLPHDSKAKTMKRKRAASLDISVIEVLPPAPRRCTKTSRAARDETDSELEDAEIQLNIKPAPTPDPTEQILEIGVVHASNTPILSQPKPKSKKKEKPAKVKKTRSLDAAKAKDVKEKLDCVRCAESFLTKAEFQKHQQIHAPKKRKIVSPAVIEDEKQETEGVPKTDMAPTKVELSSGAEAASTHCSVVASGVEKNPTQEVIPEFDSTQPMELEASDPTPDVEEKKGEKKRMKKERRQSKREKKSKTKSKDNVQDSVVTAPVEVIPQEAAKMDANAPQYPLVNKDIKAEPTGRDTPSSMGRNTPSSLGRETPDSLGRSTPTNKTTRRGYQGPLHRCNECPATFKFKYCLDNHRGVHTQKHDFKCQSCTASFRTQKGLYEHSTVHNNTDVYCPVCQQAFEREDQLTAHVITEHSENPPSPHKSEKKTMKTLYPCTYCTHVCESSEELGEHTAQHKNDRGWKCNYCPSTFRWKGSLDVHMSKHEDEAKPCNHCGMVLANKVLLKAHINAEHNLKFEVLTGAEAIAKAMGDIYA